MHTTAFVLKTADRESFILLCIDYLTKLLNTKKDQVLPLKRYGSVWNDSAVRFEKWEICLTLCFGCVASVTSVFYKVHFMQSYSS